jgi:hypothetical protein
MSRTSAPIHPTTEENSRPPESIYVVTTCRNECINDLVSGMFSVFYLDKLPNNLFIYSTLEAAQYQARFLCTPTDKRIKRQTPIVSPHFLKKKDHDDPLTTVVCIYQYLFIGDEFKIHHRELIFPLNNDRIEGLWNELWNYVSYLRDRQPLQVIPVQPINSFSFYQFLTDPERSRWLARHYGEYTVQQYDSIIREDIYDLEYIGVLRWSQEKDGWIDMWK